MKTRRFGHAGLTLTLVAAGLMVGDWIPAPDAQAVPATVVRVVDIDVAGLGSGMRRVTVARGATGMRADTPVVTDPRVVCAPIRFTSVGLTWDQPSGPSPHARLRAGGSPATLRREMEIGSDHGPDPGTQEAGPTRRGTDPVWVRDARCIGFRLEIPAGTTLSNLRAVFVNSSGTSGLPTEWKQMPGAISETAPDVAGATANAPYWVTRPGWGADESLRNCGPNYAPSLKMAFVHHTATENDYAASESDDIVRAVYAYHTQGNGWCDIAYNFLVDKYGKVFVGRFGGPALPVIGAAQQGFNTGATSVSAIGTYGSTKPPAAMVYSIKKTLAWRLDVAHLPPLGWAWMVSGGGSNNKYPAGKGVTLRLISAHRDTGFTSCPGDLLYGQLGAIRQGAHNIGLPKMFRVKQIIEGESAGDPAVAGITPGIDTVRYTANGSGTLNWTVTIVSRQTGAPVRTLRRTALTLDVSWDGMTGLFPAPAGEYDVTVSATSLSGGIARAKRFVLTVYEPVNE